MIFITSISPTHINSDRQKNAIETWLKLGTVYSFNCKAEIQDIKDQYKDVNFIETNRTMDHTYGRPLVSINAVLDWCKDQKENEFCLINSDIELSCDKPTIERIEKQMQDSIVLANRVDYGEEKNYSADHYLLGIDAFFIHKKWMKFYPQSMHCFGMTFWDYFIPYVGIKKGIDVVFLQQKIAFHKTHAVQYKPEQWLKSGQYFLWENELHQFSDKTGIGAMSRFVYNFIYNASTRKEI